MRSNWLMAACVIAIAIMMLELHPGERVARLFRDATGSAPASRSALVTDSTPRRVRDTNQRDQ